ncbi:MAG: hypothetical protein B1H03_05030 [Planctomycetales bacterium 4484_113]|nr:MAG: hypothetical protein B1H03_05030 [Planctomycetales bacterium 4484_113]
MFTFALKTFGCQMNVADSELLARMLSARGGVQVARPELADLIVVNTCVVRQKAEDKAYSFIGGLRPLALRKEAAVSVRVDAPAHWVPERLPPDALSEHALHPPFIAVIGCLVPLSADFVRQKFPYVNLLVKTSEPAVVMSELAQAFAFPSQQREPAATEHAQLGAEAAAASCTEAASGEDEALAGYPALAFPRHSAFINVIRGCNHGCSFCIVPRVRGGEVSVPVADVVAEVKSLQEQGYRHVTLLGQNIVSYGSDWKHQPGFVELMDAVLSQSEIPWLSFLTSHPADLTREMITQVLSQERVTPFLHLPIQSGSDRILDLMRRKHTVAEYLEKIELVRRTRPDVFLTTDVIVGFPGETREEFEETLALLERVRFNDAFMFAYSPRAGTLAAKYHDPQSRAEKRAWLNELITLQRGIAHEVNQRYVGRTLPAIVEGKRNGVTIVRTAFNKPVTIRHTSRQPGEFTDVRIDEVAVSTFRGVEVNA